MLQSTCWQDSTMDLLEICNMVRLCVRICAMVKSQNLITVLSSINLILFIINPIKLCEFMSSHEHGQILVRFKSKYPTLGRDEYPTVIWFVPGPDVKTRPFAFNKVGWLNCLSYSNTHIKLPPTAWLQHIQADESAAELSLQSIRLSVVGSCKGKTCYKTWSRSRWSVYWMINMISWRHCGKRKALTKIAPNSQASAAPEEPYVNKAGWRSWDLSQNCCEKGYQFPMLRKEH